MLSLRRMTKLLTLDIATRTGFAMGPAGEIKRSGSVNLDPQKEGFRRCWKNMGHFLRDLWRFRDQIPDVIVVEAAMPPGAQSSSNSTLIQWGCLAVVHTWAEMYGIPIREASVATVRKHFAGTSRFVPPDTFKPNLRNQKERTRQYTKSEIIARCKKLGLMPIDSEDDNRADAIAIHCYVSEIVYRTPPRQLVFFGERLSA